MPRHRGQRPHAWMTDFTFAADEEDDEAERDSRRRDGRLDCDLRRTALTQAAPIDPDARRRRAARA